MYRSLCVLCCVAATCYNGYHWGAQHKSFFWEMMMLVKNELEAPRDSWKALKNALSEENEPHRNDNQRILSEKYQYRNLEWNTTECTVFPHWESFCFRRSIKTIEYEEAHRMEGCIQGKSHKSSSFRGWEFCSVTSFSNEWLWKWKPHQVITENGQIWYPETLCCNEMSFWICCIHFEHWTTVIICASEENKRSTHGSCTANHTQAAKSWLVIRQACTHYSPVSLAVNACLTKLLFTPR